MESVDWAVWGPPLVVLAVGLVGGLAFALRGGERIAPAPPSEDLLARKQVLLEALRALEADHGKLEEEVYLARKEALVRDAAEVLRRLDSPEAAAAPPVTTSRRGGALAWAIGAVVFFAVAGVILQQAIAPRSDGGSMTGNQQLGEDPRVVAAQAALAKNPQDIDALNLLTRAAIESQDFETAMKRLDQAKAINPEHPGVITHYAALLVVIGRFEQGAEQAKLALTKDPSFHEARVWLALCQGNMGDMDGAEATLREVLADDKASAEDRANASSLLGSLLAARGSAGAAPAERPVAEGPPKVAGTLSSASEVAPGGVLFVYVRSSDATSGRPLAAKRFADWKLPLEFTLSEADLIMGGAWPEQVWVSARVVRSGNPSVSSPDDVESAPVGPIAPGTLDLALKLGP